MHRVRTTLKAILIAATIVGISHATPLEDAKRETERARQALRAAIDRLDALQNSADNLERRRAQRDADLRSLPGQIDAARSERDRALIAAQAARAQLPAMQERLKAVEEQFAGIKKITDTAIARLKMILNERTILHSRLELAFRKSEAFTKLAAAQSAAEAALAAAKQKCLDTLAKSSPYVKAKADQDSTDREVKRLRTATPVDSAALARASTLWINAKNLVTRLEREAVAADVDIPARQTDVDRAANDTKTALAAFEASLATDPEMAPLQQRFAAGESAVAAATENQKKAAADRAIIVGRANELEQTAVNGDSIAASAGMRLNSLEGQYAVLQRESRSWERELSQILADIDDARRDVDRARAILDRAIEKEQQAGNTPPPAPIPTPTPTPQPDPTPPTTGPSQPDGGGSKVPSPGPRPRPG